MEAALWVFLGTIIGAIASIATSVITTRNAARLQTTAGLMERKERAAEFQRQTLIDLQDAVHDQLRANALVFMADSAAYRAGGEWGRNLLGEELNDQAQLARRRVILLTARVADDKLRDHLKELGEILVRLQLARDAVTAERAHIAALETGTAVMEHIGEVLRALYPSP